MKVVRLCSCFATCLILAFSANTSNAQQTAPNPYAAACGPTEANFTVKHAPSTGNATHPPAGKALVYIIEMMPPSSLYTAKVNIGLDGVWLGATDGMTHISFAVDPGPHHLCSVYQGKALLLDENSRTLLLHLDAKAGHIYYIRYHATFWREYPGIASFEPVDEDEGPFLVQRTEEATSTLKK